MKVLLNEDLSVQLSEHLSTQDETAHVSRIGWKGKTTESCWKRP